MAVWPYARSHNRIGDVCTVVATSAMRSEQGFLSSRGLGIRISRDLPSVVRLAWCGYLICNSTRAKTL